MKIGFAMRGAGAIGTLIATRYQGITQYSGEGYDTALNLLETNDRLLDAVVVDDRVGTPAELLRVVDTALTARKHVLVVLTGPALREQQSLHDRGAVVSPALSQDGVIAWVATTLGLVVAPSASTTRVLAFGSGKGGASKTTMACLTAEAWARRGARVLMIENDLSNASLRRQYGFGRDALPFTDLASRDDTRGWTIDSVRSFVRPKEITIDGKRVTLDFLLGPSTAANLHDLKPHHWDSLYAIAAQLGYDVVIYDCSPELARRPYPLKVLENGGYVVIPCPLGILEREGARNLMDMVREHKLPLDHCALAYVAPERGSVWDDQMPIIRTMATQQFPQVHQLAMIPRDARAISLAAKRQVETGQYWSPLAVAPNSKLAQAVWAYSEALARHVGLELPEPAPKRSWWQRSWFKRNQFVAFEELPATDGVRVPEQEHAA